MKAARLIGLAVAISVGAAAVANAELAKQEELLVTFDGGIVPKQLPRQHRAPVAISVSSTVRTTHRRPGPPPQLRTIAVAINREGRIFDRGLPTCDVRRIQPATMGAARKLCGDAIIGRGRVSVVIAFADQKPFLLKAPLLVFNSRRHRGQRRIMAQIYSSDPPASLVLPFTIRRRRGIFGTVIATNLPRSAWEWAYLTRFEMTLRRLYVHRGRVRSFVSAACAAPAGFTAAVYPFAKGKFRFADGRTLTSELVRTCAVR